MSSRRYAAFACTAFALLLGCAAQSSAQTVGTIRGRVVEAGTQRPLAGAQITALGTGRGALSNARGEYTITNTPSGRQRVLAVVLGFRDTEQTVEVAAGQASTADFALVPMAISLNEIVVTGTAGAVSKRTLGNAVTKLDVAELTQNAVVSNVAEILQSRAPGVQFLVNSGVPGTAGEIRIRGAGSLAVSNVPVVYVDGIRYNTGSYGQFTPSGAGATSFRGQTTSALDGIDPNDIESIEVLKGPAAATLYGAEAAAGVIQIITKKGKAGQQVLQWTAKMEYGANNWTLPIPDNFTTCDVNRIAAAQAANWPGCVGKAAGTVIVSNPLRDDPHALRAGQVRRMSVQMRGGGDNFSYYISADQDDQEGVFFNSYQDRRSIRANFAVNPSNKVDVALSTNYVRQHVRYPLGDESAEGMLLSAFRGRPGAAPPGGIAIRDGWGQASAQEINNYNNQLRSDRITMGSTLNYRPVEWFKNRLTLGLDYTGSAAEVVATPGSVDAQFAGTPAGLTAQRAPRNYFYTVDYSGSADRKLGTDLLTTTSFGAQFIAKRFEQLAATGTGLGAPDVTLIGSAQTTSGSNTFSENKSIGFYAQELLSWKSRLYVMGALRLDNNSSFGERINRYLYPKVSLSYVASDEPALQSFFESLHVNSFKFRTAWGRAGRAPDPYLAHQVYTISRFINQNGTVGSTLNTRAVGNPDLKPEKGSEIELGFETSMLHDRAGVEFSYYRKRMTDVLVPASVPGSSGFGSSFVFTNTSPFQNLGNTLNSGLEITLRVTPINYRNLSWDSRIDIGTNHNELVSFGDPARTSLAISGQSYATVQQHRPGFPLGGYWAPLPKRNTDGSLVIDANGLAVADTNTYIGTAAPTREIGWSNTVTFLKNFRLYALMDYKGGFFNFNAKDWQRCRVATQLNCERVNDPSNVDLSNMNLAVVPPKNPDVRIWRANIAGYWVQKADFIKFRDLSLTYTVPADFARKLRLRGLAVTGAAHNLGILWTKYDGIDPEVNSYGDVLYNTGSNGFARADVYALPMLRRASISANVSF